jgi:hypothetical protein
MWLDRLCLDGLTYQALSPPPVRRPPPGLARLSPRRTPAATVRAARGALYRHRPACPGPARAVCERADSAAGKGAVSKAWSLLQDITVGPRVPAPPRTRLAGSAPHRWEHCAIHSSRASPGSCVAARSAGTGSRSPRRPGRRWRAHSPHGRRPEPPGRVAPLDHHRGRALVATPADRLHRPVLVPPAQHRDPTGSTVRCRLGRSRIGLSA